MLTSDFQRIDQHFETAGKQHLAPFAYKIFVENVEAAQEAKPNITDAELRSICDQYLTDQVLSSYVVVAEKRDETDRAIAKAGQLPFWGSVGASVFANAITFLFLVSIYLVAFGPSQEQIAEETARSLSGQQEIEAPRTGEEDRDVPIGSGN